MNRQFTVGVVDTYIHVTQFVTSLEQEPFDREAKSLEIAERTGRTQQEILAEWDAKAEAGTNAHSYAECVWMDRPHDFKAITPPMRQFNDFWAQYRDRWEVLDVERKVISHTWGMTGKFDARIKDEEDNGVYVVDIKPNWSTYGFNKRFKHPLNKLYVSRANKVAIQTSLYRMLLDEELSYTSGAYCLSLDPKGWSLHKLTDYRPVLASLLNKGW